MAATLSRSRRGALAGALVATIAIAGPLGAAAETGTDPGMGTESQGDAGSPVGHDVYRQYCASCHGPEAKGDGPVAPVLDPAPADLTRLGERYGMPLPEPKLIEFIDGRDMPKAHGTREMPVWGRDLIRNVPPSPGGEAYKRGLIEVILDHLATLQAG